MCVPIYVYIRDAGVDEEPLCSWWWIEGRRGCCCLFAGIVCGDFKSSGKVARWIVVLCEIFLSGSFHSLERKKKRICAGFELYA